MRETWLPPLLAAFLTLPCLAQGGADAAPAPVQTPAAGAPTPAALTLAQAIDLALERHPELAAARSEVQATEAAQLVAGARPAAVVEGELEDTRRETRSTTLLLGQVIELGGKRQARLDAAGRGRDVALARQALRRGQLRAEVTAVFAEVLIAQERVRLAQGALALARGGSEAAQRRVLAGKVSPIEETRARVAQSGVAVELAQARGELRAALQGLQALLGGGQQVEAVAGEIALPAVQPQHALLARLEQAPALRVARLDVERLGALARLERTRRVPDVTVGVGAKRNEELGRTQALVALSVPLPVADAWRGAELEALRRQDQARFETEAATLRLRADVTRAHERLQAAAAEARTLQGEVLPGAQSVFDATTKGYELGKFGFLDVLDAQRTLLLSRTQYLRAVAQAHLAAAEIERALGDDTLTDPGVGAPLKAIP
jgi:cobalt-zinc-cadmium efflux system outer membrane protein